jgi:hypothetical protein
LHVKVTIDPKDTEIFLSHFKPVYDLVLADPECIYVLIGQNVQVSGVFCWSEGWTTGPQWIMTVEETLNINYRVHDASVNAALIKSSAFRKVKLNNYELESKY